MNDTVKRVYKIIFRTRNYTYKLKKNLTLNYVILISFKIELIRNHESKLLIFLYNKIIQMIHTKLE